MIRTCEPDDLPAIQAIYAGHVTTGLGSFEEVPPDVPEMSRRRNAVLDRGLPYLVAERDGRLLGYAYASPYRPRSAYRFTVEDSIYVHPDAYNQGVGSQLLRRLVADCTGLGRRQMVAVIGDSANDGSIRLHARLGFRYAGQLLGMGFKFGRWVDCVIMQLPLGENTETLPEDGTTSFRWIG